MRSMRINPARVLELAHYVLDRDATIRQAAAHLGWSKTRAHAALVRVLPRLDPLLATAVQMRLAQHQAIRHLRGGASTARRWIARRPAQVKTGDILLFHQPDGKYLGVQRQHIYPRLRTAQPGDRLPEGVLLGWYHPFHPAQTAATRWTADTLEELQQAILRDWAPGLWLP